MLWNWWDYGILGSGSKKINLFIKIDKHIKKISSDIDKLDTNNAGVPLARSSSQIILKASDSVEGLEKSAGDKSSDQNIKSNRTLFSPC